MYDLRFQVKAFGLELNVLGVDGVQFRGLELVHGGHRLP